MTSPITPIIEQQGFVLLDGGLATELEKSGHDISNTLWSASLLDKHQADIQAVHRAYLDAGANCITAASYQATLPGFIEAGYSRDKARELIRKSVDVALAARDRYWLEAQDHNMIRPLVAASIGPYGAYLADGSEYSGNYSLTAGELRAFHEPRWKILADTGADLFAIETIPSAMEAAVLLELLESTPAIQAWISFSCVDGEHICDGTPLAECAELVSDCRQIIGIGINCTAPQHISSLIEQTRRSAPGKPVVIYPNSGERYAGADNSWHDPREAIDFGAAAVQWFNLGARLLGGCCRTSPSDINKMKTSLLETN